MEVGLYDHRALFYNINLTKFLYNTFIDKIYISSCKIETSIPSNIKKYKDRVKTHTNRRKNPKK